MYFAKDGNQMAKEPSVASFGTLGVPDHDPHQVGYVLGVELLHNIGAMKINRARTDLEPVGSLLARGPAHDLSENCSLARGQQLVTCERPRQHEQGFVKTFDLPLGLFQFWRLQKFPLASPSDRKSVV